MKHSWRLNAKWTVGILFVLCAAAASITYSLHRISAQEPASGAAASVIHVLAEEIVDDEMFAELQAAAQASPEAEVQVNELIVPLTGEEIAGLTREEMLEKASARLADIIYFGGVEAGTGNNGRLTFPANLHGNPAISVPAGFLDGLPIGLQIVGRHFSERLLLELALTMERERPWPLTTRASPGRAVGE